MTIRTHLLLLVAGAFVPLMIFAVAITSFSWWEQRNALELRYLERVRSMTIALDTEIDASIRVLRSLGLSPQLESGDLEDFLRPLRRFLDSQPLWSVVAVGDPKWSDVVAVGRQGKVNAVPVIEEATLRKVIETRQPAVSGLVRSPRGGFETQIAMPVLRGGKVAYVLLVAIDQSAWLKFMSQFPVGPGATLTLIDQNGLIIARTLHNRRWVGKPASPQVLEKSRETLQAAYRGKGLEGQDFYSAHSRSVRWGWTVVTGIPAAAVEAALLDSSALLASAAFVAIGLAVLLAFLFGRRIEWPITALGESARALATGAALAERAPSSIDEVEKAERAFAESGAMLRERQQALNEALAGEQQARKDAEQANRAKDEFLAMLGHELRNPLNAITTAVGVLHHVEPKGEQATRLRDIIDRQMVSLRDLVDDLLDVARVTSGKISLNRKPVDLAKVARRTVMMMSASGRLGRHRVERDYRDAWVCADETRLEQIVNNLVDNAVKYTPEEGTIAVRVRAQGGEAVLEVEDTGMGIAPDLLPRIFELFTQGERTIDRAQGGLGLGLALVRRLVELHGGTIEARSGGVGRGAAFTVRLPLIEAPKEIRAVEEPLAARNGRKLRILLVEDNEDGRQTLAMMLRMLGHEVHEADSGPNGVAGIREVHPEVAIVDIGLPGFDGYEVARRTRADDGLEAVRLVALTGYGQEDDRRNARAAGFDWFLVKPADMGALQEILAHV